MGLVHSGAVKVGKDAENDSCSVWSTVGGRRLRRKRVRDKTDGDKQTNKISRCDSLTTTTTIPRLTDKCSYLEQFFRTCQDPVIKRFLQMDRCCVLADSYLLAMVYIYHRRADIQPDRYTRLSFFAALYLAHDMVEDNEDLKMEILPWVYGIEWKLYFKDFLKARESFLLRMDFRLAVSKRTCDEVLDILAPHPLGERTRKASHGGIVHFEEVNIYWKNPMGGVSCALCREEKKTAKGEYFGQ